MRMLKKGGAPRDRRIDRRKVAMAAAAVLFLLATSVQAQNIVDYQIDSTKSWFGIQNSGFIGANNSGTFTSPFLPTIPQNAGLVNGGSIPNGSLVAAIHGDIFVASNPGVSVQFFASGDQRISQSITGNYAPGRDGVGNLTNAHTDPGQEGGKNGAVAAVINGHGNIYQSPGSYLDPFTPTGPTALPTDGLGNFDATGVSINQIDGWQDIISGIASPAKIHLNNNQYPVNGSVTYNNGSLTQVVGFNPDTGNIDPVSFHLVLPINFVFWSPVTSGGNMLGYLISTLNGQIVADPIVPEPSSVVLFGFGIVGLLSYAWRARKRKALVA